MIWRKRLIVSWEVVWWVQRYLGVDEWIMLVIRAMYEDVPTKVKLKEKRSTVAECGRN